MAEKIIEMSIDKYEALLTWARVGAEQSNQGLEFRALRNRIDDIHGIDRYTLVIRWQRLTAWGAIPPGQLHDAVPTPKGETRVLELLRPPTRADVLAALEGEIFHEALIWVTADPQGQLGWYELELFPWQGG